MTWEIVLGITALVGLVASLAGPMIKLAQSIQSQLGSMQKLLEELAF